MNYLDRQPSPEEMNEKHSFRVNGKFGRDHQQAIDQTGAKILIKTPSTGGDRVRVAGDFETIEKVKALISTNKELFS